MTPLNRFYDILLTAHRQEILIKTPSRPGWRACKEDTDPGDLVLNLKRATD